MVIKSKSLRAKLESSLILRTRMAPRPYGNCESYKMLPFSQDCYFYLLENWRYILVLLDKTFFFFSFPQSSQIWKRIISIVKVTSLDAVLNLHYYIMSGFGKIIYSLLYRIPDSSLKKKRNIQADLQINTTIIVISNNKCLLNI